MKKIILVVLMIVMITTPCLAQEIEPNGIFSIEGTEWRIRSGDIRLGFHQGEIYHTYYDLYEGEKWRKCSSSTDGLDPFYADLPVSYFQCVVLVYFGLVPFTLYQRGFLIPSLGIGFGVYGLVFYATIIPNALVKTSDSWQPSRFFSDVL